MRRVAETPVITGFERVFEKSGAALSVALASAALSAA
nr:MAG TPA_asm: hypothetical protein [Caudoviricetes sp.]